ncbi:MAG: WG repeat-containing protein [Chloroflexi bacterium AL-N5]|nr:WG repeat-containing protein [Chloroflexi bacterium AL-N5]
MADMTQHFSKHWRWVGPFLLTLLLVMTLGQSILRAGTHQPVQSQSQPQTDKQWSMVIAPQFDIAGDFVDGLARVGVAKPKPSDDPTGFPVGAYGYKDIDKYGYIDRTGKLVIPFQFAEAGDFSEGLAWVGFDSDDSDSSVDQYGYIDRTGKLVIPAQLQQAERFSGGLALVRIESQWRYINHAGQVILQPQVDSADSFSEGLARVGRKTNASPDDPNQLKYGYIDPSGQVVIPVEFAIAASFQEGLAAASMTTGDSATQGYMNPIGQWVFKRDYDTYRAGEYSEGLAAIEPSGGACSAANYCEYAYMNTKGEVVIDQIKDFQLTEAGQFSQGLAPVATGGGGRDAGGFYPATNWGYINQKGQMVIAPQFNAAGSFSEGLAWVEVDGKYGYISP